MQTKDSSSKSITPIIVVLHHREDETREIFWQLEKVTDNYSLILVDNGFDDAELLQQLHPLHYIKNEVNTGMIRPINQGLEMAQGEYISVLHNDLLIYDEGWLDHIIDFMEMRPDVGLVGLAGGHGIKEDGSLDLRGTVMNMRRHSECYRQTWRFTEVATIDGLGWVMRNKGFRLEETFGMMHLYALDLSLQYIEAGYKVYVAAVDIWHMAENHKKSSRSDSDYLNAVGGDNESYYTKVRDDFVAKWRHLLPIWRGYRDEQYLLEFEDAYGRLETEYKMALRAQEETEKHVDRIEAEHDRIKAEYNDLLVDREKVVAEYRSLEAEYNDLLVDREKVVAEYRSLEGYAKQLENDRKSKCEELDKAIEHIRVLERQIESCAPAPQVIPVNRCKRCRITRRKH